MNVFYRTARFDKWLKKLRNLRAKARIAQRVESAMHGNFGDCKPVGEGIFEMRIHFGPGYRVYYCQSKSQIYFLLVGGDKSTQKEDIAEAKKMAQICKEQEND